MAIIGSAWSADLFARLQGLGFNGSKLMVFTDAVGNGSQDHIVGKTFTTTDVGSVPGTGVGVGTGITSLLTPTISNTIFATAQANFGSFGSKLLDVAQQCEAAEVSQMALADLNSVHAPVFLGVGTVVSGSIPVDGPAWGTLIEVAAPSFAGSRWPDFANAIGVGQAAGFGSETGTVAITGSATGAPVVPGGGVGSGVIS